MKAHLLRDLPGKDEVLKPSVSQSALDGPCSQANIASESSDWTINAEFIFAALLATVFVYTLAISHTYHTPFSESSNHSKHWWKARPDAPGWLEQHQQYIAEAAAASESQELQLNFYGDATVEAWRGTQHGEPCPGCAGAVEVFAAHFGQKFNSHAWGLAGDAAQHLMWRLRKGEAVPSEGPQLSVIIVGSSDLTYASFQDDKPLTGAINSTAGRIHAVADFLLGEQPQSWVLLLGLLPRGDPTLAPDQSLAQPSKYTDAIDTINQQLERYATARQELHFLDCGLAFKEGSQDCIQSELMPDGLNLNQAGMEELAACLDPAIQELAEQLVVGADHSQQHHRA